MELALSVALHVSFLRVPPGRNGFALSRVPKRQSSSFSPTECEGLRHRRHTAEALALPELRSAIFCVGGSHQVRPIRALRDVRQHGPAANFRRAWSGHVCLVVPPASISHLSLRSMQEPFLFDPSLPAHRTHAERVGIKNGVAFRLGLAVLPQQASLSRGQVDFPTGDSIIYDENEGDGVRRITAVPLPGQMMTPDKDLVAEPYARQ